MVRVRRKNASHHQRRMSKRRPMERTHACIFAAFHFFQTETRFTWENFKNTAKKRKKMQISLIKGNQGFHCAHQASFCWLQILASVACDDFCSHVNFSKVIKLKTVRTYESQYVRWKFCVVSSCEKSTISKVDLCETQEIFAGLCAKIRAKFAGVCPLCEKVSKVVHTCAEKCRSRFFWWPNKFVKLTWQFPSVWAFAWDARAFDVVPLVHGWDFWSVLFASSCQLLGELEARSSTVKLRGVSFVW